VCPKTFCHVALWLGGIVVIGFGLVALGMLHPWFLQRDFRFRVALPGGRPIAAYALGMAFAFGWTPCIGPVLGAILTVSAASVAVANGIVLLASYSLASACRFSSRQRLPTISRQGSRRSVASAGRCSRLPEAS
jgi:cytochrome c biogenesis protein CcdA